jgi:methionine synthase II (cobalamin-independent)
LLTHAVEFYASDLGQRLVAVENASHLSDDGDTPREEGEKIIADLLREGAPRLAILQRMGPAIDPKDSAVRAVEEIQIRFLLSASAAGVVAMELDEATLRTLMEDQRAGLRQTMQQAALAQAAYVYRDFTDAELETYVEALEHPDMQRVYELMNAIQYEIMANRFEVLAARMADLHPGEEL